MDYYIWKPPVDLGETAEQWVIVTPGGTTYIALDTTQVGLLVTNAVNGRYVGDQEQRKLAAAIKLFERLAIREDDPEAGLSLTVEI